MSAKAALPGCGVCAAMQSRRAYLSLVPSCSRSLGVPSPAAPAGATDATGCNPSFDASGCLKEDVRRPTALHYMHTQPSHRHAHHACAMHCMQGRCWSTRQGASLGNRVQAHLRPEGSVVTKCCWTSECPSRGEVCGRCRSCSSWFARGCARRNGSRGTEEGSARFG